MPVICFAFAHVLYWPECMWFVLLLHMSYIDLSACNLFCFCTCLKLTWVPIWIVIYFTFARVLYWPECLLFYNWYCLCCIYFCVYVIYWLNYWLLYLFCSFSAHVLIWPECLLLYYNLFVSIMLFAHVLFWPECLHWWVLIWNWDVVSIILINVFIVLTPRTRVHHYWLYYIKLCVIWLIY